LVGALREFAVFIDGIKVGSVKNGGEARFEVRPGGHAIYVKLDFYKSKPCAIDLGQGESTSLVSGANGGFSLRLGITFTSGLKKDLFQSSPKQIPHPKPPGRSRSPFTWTAKRNVSPPRPKKSTCPRGSRSG